MNDIASALEKLNISDEQITVIKQNLTDVTGYDNIQQGLGKLISVLATARSQDVESVDSKIQNVEDVANEKRNCSYELFNYAGNGNDTFTLTFNNNPQFVLITNKNRNSLQFGIVSMSIGAFFNSSVNAIAYNMSVTNSEGVYKLKFTKNSGFDYGNTSGQNYTGICFY